MSSLTLCKNTKCIDKDTCRRYLEKPNSPYQSYLKHPKGTEKMCCDLYIPVKESK